MTMGAQQHGQLACQRDGILLLARVLGKLLQAGLHGQRAHQAAGQKQHADQHFQQPESAARGMTQAFGTACVAYGQVHAHILIQKYYYFWNFFGLNQPVESMVPSRITLP